MQNLETGVSIIHNVYINLGQQLVDPLLGQGL